MVPSNEIEVVLYIDRDGRCPFDLWFARLDAAAAIKVTTAIARMAQGNLGDVKPVGGGVAERRIQTGPGYRLYFGRDGDALVVLLAGGTKRRQQDDIAAAKKRWTDYLSRKQEEE